MSRRVVGLVVLVVLCVVGWGEGRRPELVDSRVWYTDNATLLNVQFDAAVVHMVCFCAGSFRLFIRDTLGVCGSLVVDFFFFFCQDFDQPLYTNGHSYLCPESDVGCPPLDCTPCDWSGQEVPCFFPSYPLFCFFFSHQNLVVCLPFFLAANWL